jgi:hypothetical protein
MKKPANGGLPERARFNHHKKATDILFSKPLES